MTIGRRLTKAVGLLLLLSAVAGCNKSQTNEHEQKVVGRVIGTSVYHEPGCPIRIVESEAAFSDTVLTCLLSVTSVTRSLITSFEVRCAMKDTSGDFTRPVAQPAALAWSGILEPGHSTQVTLSTYLLLLETEAARYDPESSVVELEPAHVQFEGGASWEKGGLVPHD